MPLHDGTGPWGLGPRTGRGSGRCYTGVGHRSVFQTGFSRKNGWLLGMLLPLGTAVIRDLLNPSGVLRRIVHVPSASKSGSDARKIRRDAEFTVMDEKTVPIINEKKILE